MSLKLRWIGEQDLDRVAETRLRCYAASASERPRFQDGIRADGRAKVGDFLLAERNGEAVGTTTSMSLTMWVRGAALPCQGVGYVGTIRTARRGATGANGATARGIATELMFETLRMARQRQEIVSALMPFRASYYEHFGYGVVERRNEWTVPISALPVGSCDGFGYFSAADSEAVSACRQTMVEQGQCDVEFSPASWANRHRAAENGFEFVDRPDRAGRARGWLHLSDQTVDGDRYIRVEDQAYDSLESLIRQLRFLGTFRDQYAGVILTLPIDVPLNFMLRETQVPHRPVAHPTASLKQHTRMQVRVLDHLRFFQKQSMPKDIRGHAVIAVRETEGGVSKFRLELDAGRAQAALTDAGADIECSDITWSAIAAGALRATTAAQIGLLLSNRPAAIEVLDALNCTPAPFCHEYF